MPTILPKRRFRLEERLLRNLRRSRDTRLRSHYLIDITLNEASPSPSWPRSSRSTATRSTTPPDASASAEPHPPDMDTLRVEVRDYLVRRAQKALGIHAPPNNLTAGMS